MVGPDSYVDHRGQHDAGHSDHASKADASHSVREEVHLRTIPGLVPAEPERLTRGALQLTDETYGRLQCLPFRRGASDTA